MLALKVVKKIFRTGFYESLVHSRIEKQLYGTVLKNAGVAHEFYF